MAHAVNPVTGAYVPAAHCTHVLVASRYIPTEHPRAVCARLVISNMRKYMRCFGSLPIIDCGRNE